MLVASPKVKFFGRRKDQPSEGDPTEFWAWWATAREPIAQSIADGSVQVHVDAITSNVQALHASMAWELAPGRSAQHSLVVTPEGNAELRAIATRWLEAAPQSDAVWEYHASRQPSELRGLEIGGMRVDLADMRAVTSWNENRNLLDVQLWHPLFATVPEPVRAQLCFLFLDNLLGEDDVERWIGSIDQADDPAAGLSPDQLQAEVESRRAGAKAESWVLARRTDASGEFDALVSANAALKRIDHPFAAHHLVLTISRGIEQLAGNTELQELDDAEAELVEELKGLAVYAGRVTERHRRRVHYVCTDPTAALPVARGWADRNQRFGITVTTQRDPRWEFRGELLG